jgi:predicted kinase
MIHIARATLYVLSIDAMKTRRAEGKEHEAENGQEKNVWQITNRGSSQPVGNHEITVRAEWEMSNGLRRYMQEGE